VAFEVRVFSLRFSVIGSFLGGIFISFFFVFIRLVLLLLPVRAQLDFSGDVALQDTRGETTCVELCSRPRHLEANRMSWRR